MSLDIRPNPSATGSVTGGLEYKGSYNATTNSPDLTSSLKGDFYIVSVGGTLAGVTLDVGDHIVFNQDASSPITSAMFDKIDNTDAVASVNGQTGVVSLDTDNISEGSSNLYYTNARFDTQLGTKTTDNLTEGSSNLYYTNARFDTQLGTKDTDDLSEGSSNLYYTNARFDTQLGTKTTDNLTEGSSNLYYTNARFDTQLGTKDTDDLSEGSSNLYYTNARFDTQLGTKTTDNLTEGSSNLYYTNARFDARFDTQLGTKTTDNLTEGSSNLYYTNARFDTQLGTKTTDNLTEGSSNLYYTNARFDTQLGTKTTDNLTEGSSNLYYTNARFDTQLGTKDTGDLSEGSNLYYTNARADARIGAANLTDLNDVNYTAGAGIDGYVLEYVHANNRWEAKVAPAGAVSSVNTQTGAVVLDTDDISEGSSNLYYTNARFDTQLGTKTTDNLTEGSSNLYYTNARFDTQLGTKDTGDLSEGSNLYYTNARADARIGAANLTDLNDVNYTAGAGIDGYVLEYVHANNRWEAKVASGGGSAPDVVTDSSGTNTTISTTTGIEEVHLINNGSNAVTITLPSASTAGEGYKYQIKRLGTATVTVDPNGTEQIDNGGAGVAITLDAQFESVTIVSDNSNWFII